MAEERRVKGWGVFAAVKIEGFGSVWPGREERGLWSLCGLEEGDFGSALHTQARREKRLERRE